MAAQSKMIYLIDEDGEGYARTNDPEWAEPWITLGWREVSKEEYLKVQRKTSQKERKREFDT